ncbi:MAG: addiction module protein [Ardenticatenia bacterium]|nr:addiction module protein [Ardenticatenia bacterium]
MISDDLLSQVSVLSVTERIALISVLWQTLPLADVPVYTDEQALLDKRLDDLASRPADQSPWEEARDRLRSGLP